VSRFREFLAEKFITKMNHPPIHLTEPLQFSALYKIEKCPEGGKHLLTFLTSNATSQRYWELLRKTIFKTVSGSGTIAS
jgi:hypothetical protein